MAGYYHSCEWDEVLSSDDVRSLWEQFRNDGETYDEFLNACMSWNNGDLTPLTDYVNGLRRNLRRVLSATHRYGGDALDWYVDEIHDLTEQITTYEKYYLEV